MTTRGLHGRRVRAVLLDAFGTLVTFDPPAPFLREELRARLGLEVTPEQAQAVMRAEVAYYRANHDLGSDEAGVRELRRRCGAVVRDALGPAAAGAPVEEVAEALMAAIRFRAYPEVPAALGRLRAGGARLVVVSNWDAALPGVLTGLGLGELVDGVVASAAFGAGKPEPAIFRHALDLAGAGPAEAVHAGDSVEHDVEGARGVGVAPVLVARDGADPLAPPGVPAVRDLAELADLLAPTLGD